MSSEGIQAGLDSRGSEAQSAYGLLDDGSQAGTTAKLLNIDADSEQK